jgi:hypothetical protein
MIALPERLFDKPRLLPEPPPPSKLEGSEIQSLPEWGIEGQMQRI